jgi:hypothetical protein
LASIRAKLETPAAVLAAEKLDAQWAAMGEVDAARANDAILALAADPAQALPYLKARVRPVDTPDQKRIAKLIADLDDMRFAVREKARMDLELLGELAVPALREVLQNGAGPQVRRQAMKLLELMENRAFSTNQLQMLRAVEVLERIGSPEAIAILKELAAGAPEAPPTPQAKSALERLK